MEAQQKADEVYLSVADLAERWRTTPNAVRIARHKGKAPEAVRRGRNVLFRLSAVAEWERINLHPEDTEDPADAPVERKRGRVSRPRPSTV